jgi:hypothetical protein
MPSSRFTLSRRTMLQGVLGGAGVHIGLPMLAAMVNTNGTALADGTPFPKRFGVFYWGGGIHHPSWVPTQTGPGWVAPFSLTTLATPTLKPYVTVVTGYNHKNSSPGHIPSRGIALSSSHDLTTGLPGVGTYRGQFHPEPSVDQLVADAWRGQTRFDWVGLSICRRGPYAGNSSWRRGGSVAGFVTRPADVYQRFFGMAGPAPVATATQQYQRSVLDAVKSDGHRLASRLGAEDRLRLEQHLQGIRDMERRLDAGVQGCTGPNAPAAANYGDGSDRELKLAKTTAMAELLAYALSCDLVRSFSVEFSGTQSEAIYWEVGATAGQAHHDLTHEQSPLLKDIAKLQMQALASIADALRARPEGAGTLLDNTLILGTSELANAGNHNYTDHPFVFVGKAGGAFKAGLHYRHPTPANNTAAADVLLTAVRAVGVNTAQLGQTGGESRQTSTLVTGLLS